MQNWKFIRLFKSKTQLDPSDLAELVEVMSTDPENQDGIPAGYTYFGQFLAHDLSELRQSSDSSQDPPTDIRKLRQARRPALDLDSLYGGGFDDSVVTYQRKTGKFILGRTTSGKRFDLDRRSSGIPLIADVRNDENLLVAQIHVLFMRFHNRLVDFYKNEPGGRWLSANELFELARKEVILCYQHVAIHDFLKRLLPNNVYEHIVTNKRGALVPRFRKYAVMTVEFAGAAFRIGHSMIRGTYKVSSETQAGVSLMDLFRHTGRGDINIHTPLPDEMIANWGLFFKFKDYTNWGTASGRVVNQAKRIDTGFESTMKTLPVANVTKNIIELNLTRGLNLGLATGQEVCKQLQQKHPQVSIDIGLEPMTSSYLFDRLKQDSKLKIETPLWAYILSEARETSNHSGISTLGPLGGWLVADGFMAAVHYSGVRADNRWSPDSSVVSRVLGWRKQDNSSALTLEDLIAYTYSKEL